MELSIRDLARFPYLEEVKDFIKSSGISLEDLLQKTEFAQIRGLGARRIIDGNLQAQQEDRPLVTEAACRAEILSYAFARIVLSHYKSESNYIRKRWVISECILAKSRLEAESLEFMLHLAKQCKFDVRACEAGIELHFADYLRSTKMKGPDSEWKLVKQRVNKGYVQLTKKQLPAVLSGALERHIEVPYLGTEYAELAPYIDEVRKLGKIIELRLNPLQELEQYKRCLPPCIAYLYSKIPVRKLHHQELFALVSFLNILNLSSDSILSLLSKAPDFDLKKTIYQVEHITGKSSATEYTSPGCATMKSFGLCYKPDDCCAQGWMRHPLTYYRESVRSQKQKR